MSDPRAGSDWVRLVHGEQRLALHAPLPASGAVIGKTRVTHVLDKGADTCALVVTERQLPHQAGPCLATLQPTPFCRRARSEARRGGAESVIHDTDRRWRVTSKKNNI